MLQKKELLGFLGRKTPQLGDRSHATKTLGLKQRRRHMCCSILLAEVNKSFLRSEMHAESTVILMVCTIQSKK